MDLKYDVYTITNAEGSGEERKYVRLKQYEAMTAHELEATIQQRCSLTKDLSTFVPYGETVQTVSS